MTHYLYDYDSIKLKQLTIIPRARVEYEMIDSQSSLRRVGYTDHLISNKRESRNIARSC